MIFYSLAFLAGDMYLQSQMTLPTLMIVIVTCLFGLLLMFLLRPITRLYLLPLMAALGFAYAAWVAHSALIKLPHEVEGKPLSITGTVSSLVSADKYGQHFNFQLHSNFLSGAQLRLNWPKSPVKLHPGDTLTLMVKLKRIHGTQNPGSFDAERWALQERLSATGQVLPNNNNRLLSHSYTHYIFAQLRQSLRAKIQSRLPGSNMLPWLTALTIGDRSEVNKDEWEVLRKTGTNHLMAIAGLHIGLIAAMAAWLAALLWKQLPRLMLVMPRAEFEALAGLLIGGLYAGLAGFSLPSQRACIMLSILVVALFYRRQVNSWNVWALALFVVLLIDPLAVLSDSFWLSFGTIALVIYGMRGRLNPQTFWWKWGRIQWVIGFGLIPLSFYLFHECSLISFVANCLTIPWLACVVLPLCLLSAVLLLVFPSLGYIILLIAEAALSILWQALTWFASLPYAAIHFAIPSLMLFLIFMIGVLLLLIPAGLAGRWLGFIWWLPAVFYLPIKPAMGDVNLTVLDVGQGLSTVIQTTNHVLIYDAGPRVSDNRDAGEQIILPYLRLKKINELDALVISHGDNDHIGGAPALLRTLSIKHIYTSVPEKILTPMTHLCEAGQHWAWDGVEFTFLYPTQADLGLVNDSSCVLRVQTQTHSILLPGDAEKKAEYHLLANQFKALKSTIIIAPHHGSKTSGLPAFIQAVNPQYVIYATGYRNRYHLPHPTVTASYAALHVMPFDTVNTGMLSLTLTKNTPITVEEFRRAHQRYWFDLV